MLIFFALLVAGFAGGFLAGITGIGTGFVMIVVIPIALNHLGIPASEVVRFTIANTIFATMCASFTNNLRLIIKGEIYKKETSIIALAAAVSAGLVLQLVVINSNYSKQTYNIVIIVLMTYIIMRTLMKLNASFKPKENINTFKLLTTGAVSGTISALSGLGGGSMSIPMLNLWMKVPIKKAKSISYGTIFITSLILTVVNLFNQPSIAIPYYHFGYLLLPIVLPLSLGAIIASPFGMRFGEKLSSKIVTYIFLSIIVIVMIRKIAELL